MQTAGKMFSPLARGIGSWTGQLHTNDPECEIDADNVLPVLPNDDLYHHHGITVTPRSQSVMSRNTLTEKQDGELQLPKTFVTRKGALMLFSAPEDFNQLSENDKLSVKKARRFLRQRYADHISKLGKLSRLAQSILIFGDKDYSPEDASISDPDNKIMLKFLHDLDPRQGDIRSRPGSDLSLYLHDLKTRGNSVRSRQSYDDGRQTSQSDVFLTPSQEPSMLSAGTESLASRLRPGSGQEDRWSVSSSQRSHRVLSASKLRASLKSASYMGRPSPAPPTMGEERLTYLSTSPASRRPSTSGATYRHSHIPLLELRHRSKPDMEHIGNHGINVQNTMHPGIANLPVATHLVQRPHSADSKNVHSTTQPAHVSGQITAISHDSLATTNIPDPQMDSDFSPGGASAQSQPLSHNWDDRILLDVEEAMLRSLSTSTDHSDYALSHQETVSGPEQVKQFLEDIHSEDIREEDETQQRHYEGETVADNAENKDAEDMESLPEHSLDGALRMTQPLMPVYTGGLRMSSTQFSIDDAQAENINMNDIVIEQVPDHMITDLTGTGHSLQEALQTISSRDDDDVHHGVTAIEVTNSRRGSDASSHSGVPSDGIHSDRGQSARGHRIRSARGSRVQSAKGGRNRTEEEPMIIDDSLGPPPAPPSTRSTSPNLDMAQDVAMETAEPITAELLDDAEDLLDDHDAWESFKTEAEKVQSEEQASRRHSIQVHDEDTNMPTTVDTRRTSTEDIDNIKIVTLKETVDDDGLELVETPHVTMETSSQQCFSTHKPEHLATEVVPDQLEDKTDEAASITETEIDVKVNMIENDEQTLDNAATENLFKETLKIKDSDSWGLAGQQGNLSKVAEQPEDTEVKGSDRSKEIPNVKQSHKLKETINTKDTLKVTDAPNSRDIHKVKETPKNKTTSKQYSKGLDVSQIKTPGKKSVEKKEPLLKGLESYVLKDKTPEKEKKSEVKDQAKPPGLEPRMVPAPPLKSKEEMALEKLEKEVTEIFDSKPTETALSAEEMEIERQLLQERLQTAEQKVKGEVTKPDKQVSSTKKGGKKGKKGKDLQGAGPDKEELAIQREALREAKKLEKMKRLEEAKLLEEQIKEKEDAKEQEEAESSRKAQALQDEIDMMAQEAEEARRMEEEARDEMAAQRRAVREERETRIKADVERKKQEAAKRREHEKKMIELAKRKEQEMLNRISDGEQRRMMQEEDRKKREEEERIEQERIEAEEQELERQAQEDEYNLRELETQAEEQALAFLIREREEAEARQRELQDKAAWENQQQQLKKKQLDEEQAKLEEEMRKKHQEEMKRLEEERKRFEELQQMEHEALNRLHKEMEEKRAIALQRRQVNLDRRHNLHKLSHGQGMTRPWVFTYYVHWPRETYEKRMGVDPKKKSFRTKAKPKK